MKVIRVNESHRRSWVRNAGSRSLNGRDEFSFAGKVNWMSNYLQRRSVKVDLLVLWLTLVDVLKRDGVAH